MRHPSSDARQINPRFLTIARDPRIVPGLHHACDEWCDYCPLTARCLLFQCTNEFRRQHRRPASASPVRTAAEALEFARDFAAVDEAPTAGAAATPVERRSIADDDSLAGIALEYSRRSQEFARSATMAARRPARREPPPDEALLRFRSRIYFKTTRALVGYRLTAAGMAQWCADARTCAGQTLACIDRSRAALTQFSEGDERHALTALLDAIARGIEARFPDVGAFRSRWKITAA